MAIKLPKLPERTPVKVALSLNPGLHQAVVDYAEYYRVTYGQTETESVAEILPFIVQDYLVNDRGFAKARKKHAAQNATAPPQAQTGGRNVEK